VTTPYADAELEAFLTESRVRLIKPRQYMDRWRLDASGIAPEPDLGVRAALGFDDPPR